MSAHSKWVIVLCSCIVGYPALLRVLVPDDDPICKLPAIVWLSLCHSPIMPGHCTNVSSSLIMFALARLLHASPALSECALATPLSVLACPHNCWTVLLTFHNELLSFERLAPEVMQGVECSWTDDVISCK